MFLTRRGVVCCGVLGLTVLWLLTRQRAELDEPWLSELPVEGEGPRSYAASLSNLSTEERLEKFKPIAWTHVPKCGGILMNTMMHLPGVCPSLPHDWMLCSSENPDCNGYTIDKEVGGFSLSRGMSAVPNFCPGIQRWVEHNGFNQQYIDGMKGHAVIMLRQPEQRIISGYYNKETHHGWRDEWGIPSSVLEYARVVQGTAVKMLTRDTKPLEVFFPFWRGPPSWSETRLAMRRLREGFAFVGISDKLVLTICLMHRMFGNSCRREEFGDFHRGLRHRMLRKGRYPVDALGGWTDEHDGALYKEGLRIFGESLRYYNVSWKSCGECSEAAKLAPKHSRLGRLRGAFNASLLLQRKAFNASLPLQR